MFNKSNKGDLIMKIKSFILVVLSIVLSLSIAMASTMTCPFCTAQDQNHKFCTQCGKQQPARCPDCGWDIPDATTVNFCGDCGKQPKEAATLSRGGCKAGDIVTFGAYEQDDNVQNGKEAIEWIVLYADENSAQLLSCNALDVKKYDTTGVPGLIWRDSELRAWLNGGFVAAAFSSEEMSMLQAMNVQTVQENQKQSCESTDYVTLLTIDEFYDMPEEYRLADSAESVADRLGNPSFWWLRDGCAANMAGSVAGFTPEYEADWYAGIGFGETGVRPCITVELD